MPTSTNFSIICGPCLQQRLPRCFHGDFFFSSVLLHLLFGICEGSLSHFSIYLFFNHLFISACTHRYLFSSLSYNLIFLLFILLLNLFQLGPWEFFQVGSCTQLKLPKCYPFVLFEYLISEATKCSVLNWYFLCPCPQNPAISLGSCGPFVGIGI